LPINLQYCIKNQRRLGGGRSVFIENQAASYWLLAKAEDMAEGTGCWDHLG
jgi:hypothetical protein